MTRVSNVRASSLNTRFNVSAAVIFQKWFINRGVLHRNGKLAPRFELRSHFQAPNVPCLTLSHTDSSVFKQPHSLDPPMSSPPPSLRDPPWPHGGAPPARPSAAERPPPPLQPSPRKESSLPCGAPSHRIPRPYNKVASSKPI